MKLVYRSVIVFLMVVGVACIEAPSEGEPGNLPDVGSEIDTGNGTTDAGEVDAGEVDAGEVDAGEVDAGEVDAGEVDAGEVDAGEMGTTCTIENEGQDCGTGQRCNPSGVCESKPSNPNADNRPTCFRCTEDGECPSGHRCVVDPDGFENRKACLPAKPAEGCERLYKNEFEGTSTWGHETIYCGPRGGKSVNCKFILEFGQDCDSANLTFCKSEGQECLLLVDQAEPTQEKCTYRCSIRDDCPSDAGCQPRVLSADESDMVDVCVTR